MPSSTFLPLKFGHFPSDQLCIVFSYHTSPFQTEDIPRPGRPGWNLQGLKDFCKKKNLEVSAIHGKRKIPIMADYKDALDKYLATCENKYRADEIMNSYGLEIFCHEKGFRQRLAE